MQHYDDYGTNLADEEEPFRPNTSTIRYNRPTRSHTGVIPRDYTQAIPARTSARTARNHTNMPDFAPRHDTTNSDQSISEQAFKTQPSQRLQKPPSHRKHPGFVVGALCSAALAGVIGWNVGVMPAVDHWHTGDSPVRHTQIKVNNQLCDVESMYLSNKIVVAIIPQDTSKPPMFLETNSGISGTGPHVVTIQPSYDQSGNPAMQVYVDGVQGPMIINDGHGLKLK